MRSYKQTVEVKLAITLRVKLPPDSMLPASGPYCRASMLRNEVDRWERRARDLVNPDRQDIGVSFMTVDEVKP